MSFAKTRRKTPTYYAHVLGFILSTKHKLTIGVNMKKMVLAISSIIIMTLTGCDSSNGAGVTNTNTDSVKANNDTYCYYSGYPMPDDMTKNNKDLCQKYWEEKGYIGDSIIISHDYTQEDLTGEKGKKLISELIERDKQIKIDLNNKFAQQQQAEENITPCGKVMQGFMNKRNYLSEPELISEQKAGSVYFCTVRYLKDNVDYSLPIHVQITYNPSTGKYKYKSL